jgi:PKD repeat protein
MKQQLYITILLLLPILLQAQVNSCLNTDCGTIQSNWSLVAGEEAIICEGEDFQLRSGESTPLSNINEFHWYFLESSSLNVLFDTVLTDTSFVTYKYTVSDSLACASSSSEIQLSVNLVVSSPSCGGGRRSCNWKLGSVIVKLRPRARFNVDNQQCEDTEISFSNNSCHATEYRWSFGDGTTSTDENPRHTYRNPGTYTVRLEAINDCGVDVSTQTITVVGKPDAAFSFTSDPANQCAPTTVTFNNQSNQWSGTSWSIVPFDTTRWKFTDTSMNLGSRNIAIRFLQAGEYTVRLSANNVCQESDEQEETIVIGDPVRVSLQSPGSFCEPASIRFRDLNPSINGDIDTYRWTFDNGSIPSSNEREFPAVTFNQSGTITLTATGPCGTVTRSVPVTIASTEPIAFGDNPEELCQNAPVVQLQATPAGGQWDGTTNAARDAITSSGELDPSKLNPGTYTFVYSAGSAECPNEDQLRIEILEPPNVELRAIDPACETLTFSAGNLVRYRGTIDTYRWTFEGGNPASSSDPNPSGIVFSNPGTARITIEVDGSCGTASAFIEVEIQSNTPVSIDPVDGPICSGSSPITLTASVGGGIWTGPGISDRFDGTFDPGRVSPGTYTITYSIENGACSNSATTEIEVVASQSVSIQDASFCEDSGPAAIQVSPPVGPGKAPELIRTRAFLTPAPLDREIMRSFIPLPMTTIVR